MTVRYALAGHAGDATSPAAPLEAHRSLTRTDLVLCVLPIALFLSIVSLV